MPPQPTPHAHADAAAIPGGGEKLDGVIRAALLSANEHGHIQIPSGTSAQMSAFIANLIRLEKMGFISRDAGGASYRPFALTEKGRGLKRILEKADGIHGSTPT